MLKKMLLLAMSVMALVAFAAPAGASAAEWSEEGHFHLEGHLNATLGGTGGPEFTCDVTATVDLFNNEETGEAEGEVTEVVALTGNPECHAVFPSIPLTCTITGAALTGGHIFTNGTGVHVENASFFDELEGCPVTEVAFASGDLTGTFNNATHCIEYSDDGDLETPEGTEVLVDGFLCPTTGSLEL